LRRYTKGWDQCAALKQHLAGAKSLVPHDNGGDVMLLQQIELVAGAYTPTNLSSSRAVLSAT
jgi:ApbE superfamily uncharacterized protein (UPF0280 family)